MAIKTGDTIYVLQESNNFTLTQRTMIVTDVTTRPTYPRGRARYYIGCAPNGRYDNTWHTRRILRKSRPVVRKTPYPDVPFLEK